MTIQNKNILEDNTYIATEDIVCAAYNTGELKPCPFCGNKRIMTSGRVNKNNGNIVYHVSCNDILECGATIHVCLGGKDRAAESRAEAVDKWNTRV